ncbi:hypothetical protein ABG82_00415 [Mycobacteroides immunogenum]|uniref:Uncharacterized protein n=1 Tax=Mycobacteroides immunogenum TaxID=83262 RepID=A0A7V8RYF8_9MYCO|nr:hypothetical protein [Mycobacteroides immunogenum]ORA54495.1 hypothetical protein BST24_26860 [Mycobacteroides franklinii]AMT69061.1 hypothetical protein ABG82_00415 [Mycobacteroides immunogenum]ANO02082.1 hypothetical protein BAB75_00420 [Mycobacteroides immunogenum]KIU39838.1 hypothetical protein TL11_14425 [Mycobacteroides immunogenum]KPG10865.1 hypothetical protein AN909_11205 [Mycobacteroides immunogenum]
MTVYKNRFGAGALTVFVGAAILAISGVVIFYTHPDEGNSSSATVWTAILLAGVTALVAGVVLRNSARGSGASAKSRFGLALLSVGAVIAVLMVAFMGLLLFFPDEDTTAPELSHFTPEKQRQKAQSVIDGLNTRDSAKAGVLRDYHEHYVKPEEHAADLAQEQSIQSVIPPIGCRYVLTDVRDQGTQGTKIVPGLVRPMPVYRLDAMVNQECPSQDTTPRTIGILLVQAYGHWTPMAFTY